MIILYIAISFVVLFVFATGLDFELFTGLFVPAVIIGFLFSINKKLNELTTPSEKEVIEAFTTNKQDETEQAEKD